MRSVPAARRAEPAAGRGKGREESVRPVRDAAVMTFLNYFV